MCTFLFRTVKDDFTSINEESTKSLKVLFLISTVFYGVKSVNQLGMGHYYLFMSYFARQLLQAISFPFLDLPCIIAWLVFNYRNFKKQDA